MIFWATLWKFLLITGMLLFAGMAIVVSIGGVFDIKRLFARIAAEHEEERQRSKERPTSNDLP